MVTGTAGDANIYFTYGRQLDIINGTLTYREVDAQSGAVTELNVLVDEDAPVTAARRRLLEHVKETHGHEAYQDLLDRCTPTGVCFHTYDEYMKLHSFHHDDTDDLTGRRLQTSRPTGSVTYVEVAADAAILKKDSKSGLAQAQDFVTKLLGESAVDRRNNTVVISFVMKERCASYSTLRESCKVRPAPAQQLDEVVAMNESTSVEKYAPFKGLTVEDKEWVFVDEIEYMKDAYTILLKVRYAHDPKRSSRRHVIMMEIARPTHVITYDEVTTQDDPDNPGLILPTAKVFWTNYKEESAVTDDGASFFTSGDHIDTTPTSDQMNGTTTARRRLNSEEDVFHRYVRTNKLHGFPRFYIPDNIHEQLAAGGSFRDWPEEVLEDEEVRRLQESGDGLFVDVDLTTTGTIAYADVAQRNETPIISQEPGDNAVIDNAPIQSNVDVPMQAPISFFSNADVRSDPGLIRWPRRSEFIDIEEFRLAEVVHRKELKTHQDLHVFVNGSVTDGNGRRLSFDLGEAFSYYPTREFINAPQDYHRYLRSDISHLAQLGDANSDVGRRYLLESQRRLDEVNSLFAELDSHLSMMIKKYSNDSLEARELAQKYNYRRMLQSTSETRAARRDRIVAFLGDFLRSQVEDRVYRQIRRAYDLEDDASLLSLNPNGKVSFTATGHCETFRAGWTGALDELLVFFELVGRAQTALEYANRTVNTLERGEDKICDVVTMENVMSRLMPLIGKIPYVGPLAKTFFQGFKTSVNTVLEPPCRQLKRINDKIASKRIQQKIDRFGRYFKQVDNYISAVEAMGVGASALIILDLECPRLRLNNLVTAGGTVTLCTNLGRVLEELRQALRQLKAPFNALLSRLDIFVDFLRLMNFFDLNFRIGFLSDLQGIFSAINAFLNRRLTVCLFLPCGFRMHRVCVGFWYPCGKSRIDHLIISSSNRLIVSMTGIRWCRSWFVRYPCGVNFCHAQSCFDVPVPYFCDVCVSFTINDIINGVMSVLEPLEKALSSLMNSIASALNIRFPTISIPGLPSFNLFEDMFNIFDWLFDDLLGRFPSVDMLFKELLALINGMNFNLPKCT